ncbi:piggyBac transposable element-derived protein 4-like isoform X3 [Epinephelus fuscoguttatus]|uniref:piggyBac transposable element-derived protein 4-like isoform X3 n=1 Tax=Epinephelus fuscoguttatus TaxID=293821 RepID=UPI0020D1BD75|nr:piggyBac transposable element-derived protein 4-like isoform X3 [Epinephelus fuscoguttatus]
MLFEVFILFHLYMQGQRVMQTWVPVDKVEMQAYFGLLLLAGVFKSRGENTLSLWGIDGRDLFPAVMSRKRFILISRMLRFDDRETREARFQQDHDKLGPIREVWDIWVSALQRMWAPRSEVCVDEMLIGFRGRCPFMQYMPSKPDRYGLKVWALCECETSYCWNLQFYLGKPSPTAKREEGLGKRVVMELTEGLTGTVTTDNFFYLT